MLLAFIDENQTFPVDDLRQALSRIEGVGAFRRDGLVGAVLGWEYRLENSSVLCYLSSDRETVSVHGGGPLAARFFVELRGNLDFDFRLIDEGYTFDRVVGPGTVEKDIMSWLSS